MQMLTVIQLDRIHPFTRFRTKNHQDVLLVDSPYPSSHGKQTSFTLSLIKTFDVRKEIAAFKVNAQDQRALKHIFSQIAGEES